MENLMQLQDFRKIDLCGVWANRDAILEKTQLLRFSDWWKRLVEGLRNAENPSLERIAFAYAITGDESLGLKAIQLFRQVLPGYVPLNGHSEYYPELTADLTTASACKNLAYLYSFLYPLLESEDKQKVFYEFREHGGGVIYNETLAGAWWGNAPNSNWNSHLHSGLGLSGLILAEDDEEEAQRWIDVVSGTMKAMLDLAEEEGAGIEGPGYWGGCYRSVQEFVEAMRNTNRMDMYNHRFWECCVEFPLYMSRPDKSGLINFSDTGYSGLGSSRFFYAIANALKHGLAQWFGDCIFEQSGPSIWDLLYYNPSVIPTPPDDLPACRFFKSVHLVSFRSSWEEDAAFFIMKGGSNSWSHCHLDLNSFFIDAYGERLVVDPGPGQYSIHYFTSVEPEISTSWHNTVVVDGADQRQPPRYRMSFDLEEGGDAYCRLSDYVSNDHIAMIRGDATTAYGDYLERFFRDAVYLKPDCFVIYDDIRALETRTQRHFQWLLHSELPMMDNEDGTVEIRGEKGKLIIHPVLPIEHNYKFPPPRVSPKSGKEFQCFSLRPIWHHLWNVSPGRSPYPQWDARSRSPLYGRDVKFLVILSVMRRDEPYDKVVNLVVADEITCLEIFSHGEVSKVCFNPHGSLFQKGDVVSDAERVVVREKDGKVFSWAMIRGRRLIYSGEGIVNKSNTGNVTH
jgi:hypothetical protein